MRSDMKLNAHKMYELTLISNTVISIANNSVKKLLNIPSIPRTDIICDAQDETVEKSPRYEAKS